jgi:hypothetical protein
LTHALGGTRFRIQDSADPSSSRACGDPRLSQRKLFVIAHPEVLPAVRGVSARPGTHVFVDIPPRERR